MNKKLQVFVSSTYTDLKEERQAAVEAILDAGHIPAGMELFKAGKSQMKTIRKWIDESDVYMLILGGRYGSIEAESGSSYTELEYRYAISKKMPVFAIILDDSFLFIKAASKGKDAIFEKENNTKYESFKKYVKTQIVKFVKNMEQISSIIHSQLNDILSDPDYNLVGWIRDNNENYNIQLLKDNHSLNKQIQKLQEQLNEKQNEQLGNYSFEELIKLLRQKVFFIPPQIARTNTLCNINALDLFINNYYRFVTGISNEYGRSQEDIFIFFNIMPFYISFNLLERITLTNSDAQRIQTTKSGNSFYAMLVSAGMIT